ncbi:TPM domain-containing protein [Sphingobium lactosutens]|uniref:Membrane protein n=1 Tax=Sphingobium lactosutens DS20 TaxID=1331060 RepID=T0IGZ1_9SPHN|nr:TPM domain-containing protein [Sphingobium lactosutens]EQB10965.1 membrane protein [Sphingobium lactosutens DS20]
MQLHLTQSDHELVSAAVAEAEARTSGEIVTIVARRSDSYHDVGLSWAAAAVFIALALMAAFPAHLRAFLSMLLLDWEHELADWKLLTGLLGILILKFLIVRYLLAIMPLRMLVTPKATKARRARRRAILLFRTAAEARTRGRTGVLIYISLDEHRAELVADRAINEKVSPDAWGDAMATLVDALRQDRAGEGLAAAVAQVGAVLAAHFPRAADDINELPDRLIEL